MSSANPRLDSAMSDQILPSEVSLQSDTWLYRYRHFPVFSTTWFRYRAFAFGGAQLMLLVLLPLLVLLQHRDLKAFFVFAGPMYGGGAALFLFGPAMAVWVRQKAFPVRKEAVLLCTALCLGALLSFGLYKGLNYAAKYLAYSNGNVDISFWHPTPEQRPSLGDSQLPEQKGVAASVLSPDNTADNTADNDSALVEMLLKFVRIVPLAGMLIYTGSGFDLWIFYRQRKKLAEALRLQELRRAQEARREAELRLSVLVAQVEPHFLFNTLAGVRSAILTEPARATAIVDHLVDYLRATIPQMRDDGASVQGRLAQQLDAARAYLGLMQARIPRLSFSVESDVTDAALPPLMLISLVENAIKHGVEPKIGPVHIAVTARRIVNNGEEQLVLTVADDGAGFGGATSGSGIGLANIRERLDATFGQRASLQLKARAEGGIAAIITVPLLH